MKSAFPGAQFANHDLKVQPPICCVNFENNFSIPDIGSISGKLLSPLTESDYQSPHCRTKPINLSKKFLPLLKSFLRKKCPTHTLSGKTLCYSPKLYQEYPKLISQKVHQADFLLRYLAITSGIFSSHQSGVKFFIFFLYIKVVPKCQYKKKVSVKGKF